MDFSINLSVNFFKMEFHLRFLFYNSAIMNKGEFL